MTGRGWYVAAAIGWCLLMALLIWSSGDCPFAVEPC